MASETPKICRGYISHVRVRDKLYDLSSKKVDLPGRERRLLGEAAELGGLEGDGSKMSLMNEFMIDMPFLEMPVSGCTCLSTR
jgi:hypothetical protein